MDFDSLTIGQIKQIKAMFGDVQPAQFEPSRIGQAVLVRSRGSGVWIGTLVSRHATAAGHSVTLADARRIWSWFGAAECSQLAATGPTGGKIGIASAPIVHEVLEEHVASPAAIAAVAQIAPWSA